MDEQGAIRELFPIKLVGGFITLDNVAGCVGCSFCLSRRHPIWRHIFKGNIKIDNVFDSPEGAYTLLRDMVPFYRARVPLRFGHNTDARFQWAFGRQLYSLLPKEQPFIVMTRFPLEKEDLGWFKGQSNLLLKLSLTPSSKSLRVKSDVWSILKSVEGVHEGNIFYLLGPIVRDNKEEALAIINSLPPDSWVEVKGLTKSGIPHMEDVPSISEEVLCEIRQAAKERQLTVTDYFGCRMRQELKRPFYKVDFLPIHILESCKSCRNFQRCHIRFNREEKEKDLFALAKEIGICVESFKWAGSRTIEANIKEPASRGDETYLSEMTNVRVLLSTVPSGSEGGSFCLDAEAVFARWEKFGMLPSTKLRKMAEQLLKEVSAK